MNQPALAFAGPKPLTPARPLLPDAEALLPYLRRIDEARWYSNLGPLTRALEARCAAMMDLAPDHAVSASSATAALWAALVAVGGRRGACLLPSWTFGATAAAALHAGLTPHFLDVDPATWALDPEHTLERARLLRPSAIVLVAPFGAPPDLDAWAHVARESRCPVVIDAAAAFDALTELSGVGAVAAVVSLHATKTLPAGEGGLLLTRDAPMAAAARRLLNFGFHGDRIAREPGFNGKMSEYNAAVGLASLDAWPARRAAWRRARDLVRASVADIPGVTLGPDAGGRHAASTFNVLTPEPADEVIARLSDFAVTGLRWWGAGCARQPAYDPYPRDATPHGDDLAARAVGLPLHPDLSAEDAARIGEAVGKSLPLETPRPPQPATLSAVSGMRAVLADLHARWPVQTRADDPPSKHE